MSQFLTPDFFVMRTPALPWDVVPIGPTGLRQRQFASGNDGTAASFDRDVIVLRARLRAIVRRPDVRHAIATASGSLAARLEPWLSGDDSDATSVEPAIVRYVMRMAGRATPFGLFAGCTTGSVGEVTNLAVSDPSTHERHTRLNLDLLFALVMLLSRREPLRSSFRYLKGSDARQRNEAEGYDDTVTLGVLASQGFLPGYGLEVGAVIGTSEARLEFENGRGLSLPRPPSMALREFAPGTSSTRTAGASRRACFFSRRKRRPSGSEFDLEARALVEERAAPQAAENVTAQGLANQVVRAVRICDVNLAHRSRISDDEEFRFQPPMETFGYELGQHDGGQGFSWGEQEVLLRRGVRFRLANVGASRLVEAGRGLGFPLCLRCGQSRSPFASAMELQTFGDAHRDRCGQPRHRRASTPTSPPRHCRSGVRARTRRTLFSSRFGSARPACSTWRPTTSSSSSSVDQAPRRLTRSSTIPMPGGSGLLDQLCERFPDVAAQARAVAAECPAQCTRSCIDCLQTFRNGFYHAHLDRNLAVARFDAWGDSLRPTHEVPPRHPSTPPAPQQRPVNNAERRLRDNDVTCRVSQPVGSARRRLRATARDDDAGLLLPDR